MNGKVDIKYSISIILYCLISVIIILCLLIYCLFHHQITRTMPFQTVILYWLTHTPVEQSISIRSIYQWTCIHTLQKNPTVSVCRRLSPHRHKLYHKNLTWPEIKLRFIHDKTYRFSNNGSIFNGLYTADIWMTAGILMSLHPLWEGGCLHLIFQPLACIMQPKVCGSRHVFNVNHDMEGSGSNEHKQWYERWYFVFIYNMYNNYVATSRRGQSL